MVGGLRIPSLLTGDPTVLVAAVAIDFVVGDPVYSFHPVRLVGRALSWTERELRRLRLDGYGGGIVLFVCLATASVGLLVALLRGAALAGRSAEWVVHLLLVYSLLALGDLIHHVRRIEAAVQAGDLLGARRAVSALVGRDTDRMDGAACRRAGVESLSENLTDGFVSPVFWYVLGGPVGLVLFKVVSTMDSMVGYKNARYLRFGWCGARLDDVMNYVPARLTWLVITFVAGLLPECSTLKAWRIALAQHSVLPGPNSGWGEAATAGAIQRRIVGPIWRGGVQVTDLWIGAPSDPPLASAADVRRAMRVAIAAAVVVTMLSIVALVV